MNEDGDVVDRVTHYTPSAVAAVGFILLVWSSIEFGWLVSVDAPTIYRPKYVVGYVTIVPTCIGMMLSKRWIERSRVPVSRYRTVGKYWLVGGVAFLAFNVALMSFFPTESVWIVANWTRWALSLGLAIGLVLGVTQARAIESTLTAERQTMHAEHMEQQRDLIDQLNGILRHEVLNATQVIAGNAELLMDADDPIDPTDERVERVYRQAEEVSEVIQEVRVLLNALEESRDLRSVDVAAVLEEEVEQVAAMHPDVDIERSIADDVWIDADELVGRTFGNLLSNAIEHNDTDSLVVSIEAMERDGSFVVTIADNGGGIPEEKQDTLFERPQFSDHGLGLYLVEELVHKYGGTITLVETGNEGTTFEIEFPLSDPDVREGA